MCLLSEGMLQPGEVGTKIILILQIKKLRHRVKARMDMGDLQSSTVT